MNISESFTEKVQLETLGPYELETSNLKIQFNQRERTGRSLGIEHQFR